MTTLPPHAQKSKRILSEAHKAKLSAARKGKPNPKNSHPLSDATKAKLSVAGKGRAAWNKGVPMTPEAREHMSKVQIGRKASDTTKAKMSTSQKRRRATTPSIGTPRSEETRKKMSASHKSRYANGYSMSEEARKQVGAKHKGMVHSEATKAKLSKAAKGRIPPIAGKKHTLEARAKMSKAVHAQWERMTEEQRAAEIERLQASNSNIIRSHLEEIIAAELDEQGIVYEQQKRIGWYRVDFYIPAENRIIEAQGCFWHACEDCGQDFHKKMRLKDAKRHEYLLRKGYNLTLIWEHERKSKIRRFRTKNGGG